MKKLILILVVLFSLILKNVYSLSFGSLIKENYAELNQNESKEFIILLWNSGESPINVKFKEKSIPENWFVVFKTEEIVIQPTNIENKEENVEYVSTSSGYVKAIPVRIIIRPSDTSKKGIYQVIISAIANEEKNGLINMIQERDFIFKINVTASNNYNKNIQSDTLEEIKIYENNKQQITGNEIKPIFIKSSLIVISVFIIIFFIILLKIKYKS